MGERVFRIWGSGKLTSSGCPAGGRRLPKVYAARAWPDFLAERQRANARLALQEALAATDKRIKKIHDALKLGQLAELPKNALLRASETLQREEQRAEALTLRDAVLRARPWQLTASQNALTRCLAVGLTMCLLSARAYAQTHPEKQVRGQTFAQLVKYCCVSNGPLTGTTFTSPVDSIMGLHV